MPEIISNIFGRSRNDAVTAADDVATATTEAYGAPAVDVAVTPEAGATTAIDTEQAGDTAEGADATETDTTEATSTDDVTADSDSEDRDSEDSDSEDSDDTTDQDVADDQAAEDDIEDADDADDSDADDDLDADAADEDEEISEEVEPVAVEQVDGPAVAETDVADDDQPESRPAAGVRGSTTMADAVVSKVVSAAAGKIDGVHSLDDDLSVEVADEIATITIPLVVEFGHPVKALAEQVRVAVIEAVEQILGLDVAVVDVHVSDIHLTDV